MQRRYLLFDIDGTLINAGGAGRRAMVAAFQAVLGGGDLTQHYSFAGKTDLQIMADIARRARVAPQRFTQTIEAIKRAYIGNLKQTLQEASGFAVYPHIRALLTACQQQPEFELALLTGNLAHGARLKLEHASLWHHFAWGVFGDLSEDRRELAQQALRIITGRSKPEGAADVVVIGDTTNDVRCGKAIGATTIAFFSGFEPLKDLQLSQPDFLIHDFKDLYSILGMTES